MCYHPGVDGDTWLAWTALGAGSLGLATRVFWFAVRANRRHRANQLIAWTVGLVCSLSTMAMDPGDATRWKGGLSWPVWTLIGLVLGSWIEGDINRIRDGEYPSWATWRRDLRRDLQASNSQRGFASGTIPSWQGTVDGVNTTH